jgi:hypothetical protein
LGAGVDVEATAHAIQLQNRQSEIKAAGQERLLMLQSQIIQAQRDLDDLSRTAQRQTTQLETQLSTLRAEIEQHQSGIKTTQDKITQIQQTIKNDETAYQTEITRLKTEMEQTESELATIQAQLQAAYDELNKPGLWATELPVIVEIDPPFKTEDNSGDHQDDSSHDENDDHVEKEDREDKEDKKEKDDEQDDNDHDDD